MLQRPPGSSCKRRHRLCRPHHRRPPGNLATSQQALSAQAQFDGPQRKVSVRPAGQDGLIYLDLADEFWRCVEIGANGWRIADDPPVRFRRSAAMQPLPLLDAASHGLRTSPHVRLDRLPRMADFAIWATACETAPWPTGAFARAYEANRRAAVEGVIDADPVAACVREIMAERSAWTGCAADLLRTEADLAGNGASRGSSGWPKNPRALAGRLRRVQTALRTLGIEVTFGREGRAGTRIIIRMSRAPETPSAPTAASATSRSG